MKKRIVVIPLVAGIAFQACGCQKADSLNATPDTQAVTEASASESQVTSENTSATIETTETVPQETEIIIVYADPVSVTRYDARGNVIGMVKYEYDLSGKKTKCTNLDSEGNIISRYEFEYDVAGYMIKQNDYDAKSNLMHSSEFKYDESGNLIEREMRGAHGDFLSLQNYDYDNYGNLVQETKKVICKYTSRRIYEYDDLEHLTKSTYYLDNNTIFSQTEYQTDADGNITGIVEYKPEGDIIYQYSAEYDDNDNKIKESSVTYTKDNNIEEEWYEMEYDDSGKLTAVIRYIPDIGILCRTEYSY